MIALAVMLAGGLGAVTRFVVDSLVQRHSRWSLPVGTVLINVTGSFVLGVLTGLVLFHAAPGDVEAVAGTGFCGGYTTFSTASVEAARLLRTDRRWTAALHAAGMLLLSLAGAGLGLWITSW